MEYHEYLILLAWFVVAVFVVSMATLYFFPPVKLVPPYRPYVVNPSLNLPVEKIVLPPRKCGEGVDCYKG